jgi:carbon storage regulator
MLVLTRRRGEIITIADCIHLKVLEIRGNQVRFGFIAPKELSIHRKEIWVKIQNEKQLHQAPQDDFQTLFLEASNGEL